MKRRDFIPRMISGSAIVAVMPVVLSSCEKEDLDPNDNSGMQNDDNNSNANTIDLEDPNFSALKSKGGYAYKGNIIVINTGNETFLAFSSRCTHSGCTVNYNSTNNNIPCPCHGSIFSMNGSVLQGPATTALQKYTITRVGNILTIG